MRRMIFFLWILFLSPSITWTQEKIEVPVWNVGDKWVFTQGNIEVIGADKKSYAVNFSKDTCILENMGFETIIFEKSTLNRIYALKGDIREKYSLGLKNIFDFPFSLGKQWKRDYSAKPILTEGYQTPRGIPALDYYENIRIVGWEDIGIKAGKFRALKIELISGHKEYTFGIFPGPAYQETGYYWYSPDVKYFVKRQYDRALTEAHEKIFNWELTSFQLKK